MRLVKGFLRDKERSQTINDSLLEVANYLALQIPTPKGKGPKEPTRRDRWIDEFLTAYYGLPELGAVQLDAFFLWVVQHVVETLELPDGPDKRAFDIVTGVLTNNTEGSAERRQIFPMLDSKGEGPGWLAHRICGRRDPTSARLAVLDAANFVSQPAGEARRAELQKRRAGVVTRQGQSAIVEQVKQARQRARSEFFHLCMLRLVEVAKPQ